MVLFVLCFGVDFLCSLNLMPAFIYSFSNVRVTEKVQVGKDQEKAQSEKVAACWEITAHSAYNIYLNVNFVFPA